MSRVRPPRDEWSRINDLERRLAALERSSSIQAAMSALDPAGNVRMVIGQLDENVWGLQVFDADGNDLVTVDNAGLHVYDTAGHEEVRAGKVNSSPDIYGLAVAPATGSPPGTLQQVGGVLVALGSDVTGITTSTPTAVSGGSVTAEIGPSGRALTLVACEIGTGGSNQVGFIDLFCDGVRVPDAGLASSASNGAVNATQCCPWVVTGLTPGTHTFALYYRVSSGANCGFTAPALTVQPL